MTSSDVAHGRAAGARRGEVPAGGAVREFRPGTRPPPPRLSVRHRQEVPANRWPTSFEPEELGRRERQRFGGFRAQGWCLMVPATRAIRDQSCREGTRIAGPRPPPSRAEVAAPGPRTCAPTMGEARAAVFRGGRRGSRSLCNTRPQPRGLSTRRPSLNWPRRQGLASRTRPGIGARTNGGADAAVLAPPVTAALLERAPSRAVPTVRHHCLGLRRAQAYDAAAPCLGWRRRWGQA